MKVSQRRDGKTPSGATSKKGASHSTPAPTATPASTPEASRSGPHATATRPKVLARLPNLDVAELDQVLESVTPQSSQKLLSQRLSTAILIGGVLFLVVASSPFLASKDKSVAPPVDANARSTPPASRPAAESGVARNSQGEGPSLGLNPGETAIPAVISGPSDAPKAQPTTVRPAKSDQSQWGLPEVAAPSIAQTTASPIAAPSVNPAWEEASAGPASVADGQRLRAAAPTPTPATTAIPTYPTTPYAAGYEAVRPNPGYYGTTSQQPGTGDIYGATSQQPATGGIPLLAQRPDVPGRATAGPYPTTAAPVNAGIAPSTGSGNFDSAIPTSYPTTSAPAQEPGTARLQGVIEKPNYRPNYDYSRPSLR